MVETEGISGRYLDQCRLAGLLSKFELPGRFPGDADRYGLAPVSRTWWRSSLAELAGSRSQARPAAGATCCAPGWLATAGSAASVMHPNTVGGATGRTLPVVNDPKPWSAMRRRQAASTARPGAEHDRRVDRITNPFRQQ